METAVEPHLPPPAVFLSEDIKMRVSVRSLPEAFRLPGFKLSAIFCKLLLGKSPEKDVTVCHGLREWDSRAFDASPVRVRLVQCELLSLQFSGFNPFTNSYSCHRGVIPDSSSLKQ